MSSSCTPAKSVDPRLAAGFAAVEDRFHRMASRHQYGTITPEIQVSDGSIRDVTIEKNDKEKITVK